MKLDDTIDHAIMGYPTLYRGFDYWGSRTRVLDHLFLAIGNGFEWRYGQLQCKPHHLEHKRKGKVRFPKDYFTRFMQRYISLPNGEKFYYGEERAHEPITLSSIHEYSQICNIPDSVKSDWLLGADEVIKIVRAATQERLATDGTLHLIAKVEKRISQLKERAKL